MGFLFAMIVVNCTGTISVVCSLSRLEFLLFPLPLSHKWLAYVTNEHGSVFTRPNNVHMNVVPRSTMNTDGETENLL